MEQKYIATYLVEKMGLLGKGSEATIDTNEVEIKRCICVIDQYLRVTQVKSYVESKAETQLSDDSARPR